ncbi:hypothetical protein AMB3_1570 [plant metagenome]
MVRQSAGGPRPDGCGRDGDKAPATATQAPSIPKRCDRAGTRGLHGTAGMPRARPAEAGAWPGARQ